MLPSWRRRGVDVLRANGVPGIVYVATGLSTGESPMWWDAIEDRLLSVPEIDLPEGRHVDVSTAKRKKAVFKALRKWVFSLPPERIGPEVAAFCGFGEDRWKRYATVAASGETLARFANDPLLSIGCHTHRHIPCGLLSDGEVEADVRLALARLSAQGIRPRHFAFPYGHDEHRASRFAAFFESCGFVSAVTTFKGFVTPGASNPLFLPRIGVSEYRGFPRVDSLPRLRIRLALKGLFGAFAKGTGRPFGKGAGGR